MAKSELAVTRTNSIQDEIARRQKLLARGAGGSPPSQDSVERADVDTQDDIGFAVTELRSQTLQTIDAALARLEAGTYGHCIDRSGALPDSRLRALPYTVRCRQCEDKREAAAQRRPGEARRAAPVLFLESAGGRSNGSGPCLSRNSWRLV
jgi:DnaK suppressor protein